MISIGINIIGGRGDNQRCKCQELHQLTEEVPEEIIVASDSGGEPNNDVPTVGGSQAGISTTIATIQREVNDTKETEGMQMILQEIRNMKQKIETLVVDQETRTKRLGRAKERMRHDDEKQSSDEVQSKNNSHGNAITAVQEATGIDKKEEKPLKVQNSPKRWAEMEDSDGR